MKRTGVENSSQQKKSIVPLKETLLECTAKSVEVLSEPRLENYFLSDIAWLKDRSEIWENSRMRVALIGVTSTGKSTLVNAILGGEILPRGVRPTSNTLVTCKRGDELSAGVYFNNGTYMRYGRTEISERLKDLADEETNPGNEKDVREIEVQSPEFVFGGSVELVDTPGLDAFGLEWHEELTLQTLLPAVDAVIYITDAKAKSEEIIAKHLSCIQQNVKPTILVQNKMDSVEPELGPCGTIRLDRHAVLKRLLECLERLARGVYPASMSVPVVQMSALRALQGDQAGSGLQKLMETLECFLSETEPEVWSDRCKRLQSWLLSLIQSAITTDAIAQKELIIKKQDELDSIAVRIEESRGRLGMSFEKLKKTTGDQCTSIKHRVQDLSSRSVQKAKAIVCELTALKPVAAMSDLSRDLQSELLDLEKRLDVSPCDFRARIPHFPPEKMIHLHINSETIERVVKKGGLFNSLWRHLHLGGYERTTTTISKFDKALFTKESEEKIDGILNFVDNSCDLLREEMGRRYSLLEKELACKQAKVRDQLDASVSLELRNEVALRLEPVVQMLTDALQKLSVKGQPVYQNSVLHINEDLSSKDYPSYATDLLMLANAVTGLRFSAIRDVMLSRVGASSADSARRALIVGFDSVSLREFLQRFWAEACPFDVIPGVPAYRENTCGLSRIGAILLLDQSIETDRDELKRMLSEPQTVFLLLDAEKPGATASMLLRSPLASLLDSSTALVACVENMKVLSESGIESEVEAVISFLEIARELGAKTYGCIVNDDRIFLTYLVDYLLGTNKFASVRDEQTALAAIAPEGLDNTGMEHIASFLRCWRASIIDPKGDL